MTTGEKIKAERKKAGLTLEELSGKIGVSFQTLSQWKTDRRKPKFETLCKIADALNITVYEFLPTCAVMRTEPINNCQALPEVALDLGTSIRLRRIAAKLNKPQEQVVKDLVYGLYNLLRTDEGEENG